MFFMSTHNNLLFLILTNISLHAAAWTVKTTHDGTAHFGINRSVELKANTNTALESREAFIIKSPGRVPVLVAPVPSSDNLVEIEAPEVDQWPPKLITMKIASELNTLLAEFDDIRAALKDNEPDKALDKVRTVRSRYPELSYFNFLEASALVMKGDRKQAVTKLKEGLKDFPNQESALELLRALGETTAQ